MRRFLIGLLALTISIPPFAVYAAKQQSADRSGAMVLGADEVDKAPEVIHYVAPKYPKAALEKGLEGKVLVEAVIDENGNVIDARIKYSDNEIFNEAALAAIKQTKFKPALLNGHPVKVRITVPFVFRLKENGESR